MFICVYKYEVVYYMIFMYLYCKKLIDYVCNVMLNIKIYVEVYRR